MTPEILGVVRHILTIAGGALVTRGYIGSGDLELLAGAIATVAGIAWSIYEKRKAKTP